MPRKYIVPDISSVSLFKEKEKISQRWNSLELSVPKKGLQEKKKISSTKFCAWLQKLHDTLKVFQDLPYNYKYVNKSCFRCFFLCVRQLHGQEHTYHFFIIYTCIKIIKKGLHLKHIHMYMYIYLRFHSYSEKGRTLVPMSQVMFHLFLFPIKIFNNLIYLIMYIFIGLPTLYM